MKKPYIPHQTRPKDHRLGDNQTKLFTILLNGHTVWHQIVSKARLGQEYTLHHQLYQLRQLIDNAIKEIEK